MEKNLDISLILLVGLITLSGCITNSPKQTAHSVIVTSPTPQIQYNVMEPVTDGNLKITILRAIDGDRTYGTGKKYSVKIRLENLGTEKNIQVFNSDFRLLSSNYNLQQNAFLKSDLGPRQYDEPILDFTIPQDALDLKLQFDFSGPSGIGKGGKIVIFNL
jgi:hypothetical protein